MTHNFPFASKLGMIVSSSSAAADAVDDETIDATKESLFFAIKSFNAGYFSLIISLQKRISSCPDDFFLKTHIGDL